MERDRGGILFEQGREPLLDDYTIVADPGFDRERQETPVNVSITAGPAAIGGGKCRDRARANANRFEALSVVPVLQPSAGGLNDRARQLRLANERGRRAPRAA